MEDFWVTEVEMLLHKSFFLSLFLSFFTICEGY